MAARHGTATAGPMDHVETFVDAAEGLVEAVGRSDLAAPVPTCPGWSTYDVVVHLGNVHGWAATVVETGIESPEQHDQPRSRRIGVVADWYAGKAGDLYQVLREADPGSACWSFSRFHRTRGFWPRRQTHETLIHLVDVDQAGGRTSRLPAQVAADGVGEVLEVFLPRMRDRGFPAALTAPLSLALSDTGHAWTVSPQVDAAPLIAAGVAPGADVVEGPAAVVFQVLWKRLPMLDRDVTFRGDEERIQAFLSSRLTP